MKYYFILILLLLSNISIGQAPQKLSYQAVIRDVNNNLLSMKNISMRISILKGETASNAVYIETHIAKTNVNGLVSLQMGSGSNILGNFSKIEWSKGPYFVFTETDPDGGFDYRINGKSELLSVPYALYALNNSTFDTTSLHTRIIDLQYQANENKKYIEMNVDSIKVNAAQIETNLDSIKANSAQIDKNIDSINTKIDILDLISILSNNQKIGKIINAITVEDNDSKDIISNGNLKSSKNISLFGNIESSGTSSTIGSLNKPFKDLFVSSHSIYIASDVIGQNIPPTILSNVDGNIQLSSGGLKLLGSNAAFIAPRIIGTLSGNANTASKLLNTRKINGVDFDGSADILLPSDTQKLLSFNNVGTGDASGVAFDGSEAKTISYNSIGAAPLAGSTLITTVGDITTGSIPYSLLVGVVPIWNQSTTGNAATVTTNANLTGIIRSIGNLTSIASGTISNSLLENEAVGRLSGTNTGDETITTLHTKLGIVTLSGTNTGDQILPTLESLRRSENEIDPYFDESGILSKLTLSSNSSEKQTEEIDLSKSIHKLIGKEASNYILRNGFEGQVIYIVPFGDDTNLKNITITILNGTKWNSDLLYTSDEIRSIIWTPFTDKSPSETLRMAVFTENKWFINGGTSILQR
jgi:hypothetical protein